jgi:hypothetical protein
MSARWGSAGDPSLRRSASFSEEAQLRLPLYREVSARTGLLIPNTGATERLRRFLQSTLPLGAQDQIAEEIRARRARISDEIEGRVVLSVDTALAAVKRLGFESRSRFFSSLTRPFRFSLAITPGALGDLP